MQLKRLESLQTLMVQGGTVVSEVAQFLVKAREELSAFQREQQTFAEAQQRLSEEKNELLLQLSIAGKNAEEALLRATQSESKVEQLTRELVVRDEQVSRVEFESERSKSAE